MEEELETCPFCGSSAQVMDCGAGGFSVECKECDAEIGNDYEADGCKGLYETIEEAIAAWNNRHFPEGCTPEDAKKLREFNHDLACENHVLICALQKAFNRFNQYEQDQNHLFPAHDHKAFMRELECALDV